MRSGEILATNLCGLYFKKIKLFSIKNNGVFNTHAFSRIKIFRRMLPVVGGMVEVRNEF